MYVTLHVFILPCLAYLVFAAYHLILHWFVLVSSIVCVYIGVVHTAW